MVRIGVIGIGNMGRSHVMHLMEGKVNGAKLTAVCDIKPERLAWMQEQGYTQPKQYADAESLIKGGEVDAVMIAVPHYDHPGIAKMAFAQGLHVLVEKPAGVYTAQVREMNEAAKESGKVFGIMYNQRTNPVYQKVRQLVQNGELGTINRAIWIITNWYRPQAYHNSSDWRSTWEKEGGGVLINQCPHQLDLWWWILGMPKRIRSFMGFGKHYKIEVEDDVTTYMEYENGMTGLFVTCTAEVPGTNRLEISGTRGRLVVENNQIIFDRLVEDEREFNEKNRIPFGQPERWKCEVPADSSGGEQHVGIMNNFVQAIEHGTPLLAPGEEGIMGLSISNAMHMSAWEEDWVDPGNLDEKRFYELLQDKIKHSTVKKELWETVGDVRGTH